MICESMPSSPLVTRKAKGANAFSRTIFGVVYNNEAVLNTPQIGGGAETDEEE